VDDPLPWSGPRPFHVSQRTVECEAVVSLELVPVDGAPLPPGSPGQYLTLELTLPEQPSPVIRCYSLSRAPSPESYRITVKALRPRPGAPPPLASRHLVHHVRPGDVLHVRAPLGHFVLDPQAETPAVLIGGGIGLTPLLSMLEAAVAAGPRRDLWVFLGFRRGAEHPFRSRLRELSGEERVRLLTCYSRPDPDDALGRDHDRVGWVTGDLLAETLPPSDLPYDFYLCGPPAFLSSLTADLQRLGVPASRVHLESFGARTARRVTRSLKRPTVPWHVHFVRSELTAPWDPSHGSLLELALDRGAFLPFACGTGRCGTCATGLLKGEVSYPLTPEFPLGPGRCLPCVAVPESDLELDA
jgi:ferredoxin-NADP reductase